MVGYQRGLICVIEGLAGLAAAQARPERAARLCGAAQALRVSTGRNHLLPDERFYQERTIAVVRAQLGETTFMAAWAKGRALSLEQTVADALNATAQLQPTAIPHHDSDSPSTAR